MLNLCYQKLFIHGISIKYPLAKAVCVCDDWAEIEECILIKQFHHIHNYHLSTDPSVLWIDTKLRIVEMGRKVNGLRFILSTIVYVGLLYPLMFVLVCLFYYCIFISSVYPTYYPSRVSFTSPSIVFPCRGEAYVHLSGSGEGCLCPLSCPSLGVARANENKR